MNRPRAKTIRARQLQGKPVAAADAELAVHRLSRVGNRRFVLPKLPAAVKERANDILLAKLAEVLGWTRAAA